MTHPMDFESAIEQIEKCDFQCQGGPLSNNVAWRWLKQQEDHLPIEARQALMVGHDEVIRLRRQLAELEPKAHAYDTIAQLARLTEKDVLRGMGEDPAWRMKAVVEKDAAKRAAEREDS
jgi:hypothetical protein